MENVKQLGYCNAYSRTWSVDGLGVEITELISYKTPVARLYKKLDEMQPFKMTVGRCAKCSVSTWKQVRRFVRENTREYEFEGALNTYANMHGRGWFDTDFDFEFDAVACLSRKTLCDEYKPGRFFPAWRGFVNGVYFVEGMHK